MADCMSRRKLGAPGVQQPVTTQTGCATSEQCRVQSHANAAVAQVGSAKEERTARVGRGGQGSSVRSGDEAARQLLELREGGSQDGRLHVQAEVGGPRGTATSHCSVWWYDL